MIDINIETKYQKELDNLLDEMQLHDGTWLHEVDTSKVYNIDDAIKNLEAIFYEEQTNRITRTASSNPVVKS